MVCCKMSYNTAENFAQLKCFKVHIHSSFINFAAGGHLLESIGKQKRNLVMKFFIIQSSLKLKQAGIDSMCIQNLYSGPLF